ncbi:MAG: hypothetical protein IOD12_17605 [Silvanigrellales bacterium]|nr:hypothetical protein [Silvanigrellales bacterium]
MNAFLGILTLALLVGTSACRTRTFGAEKENNAAAKLNSEATTSEESPYLHGGPFNFGISFSRVSEKKAKDFWSSFQDKASFTGSLSPGDVTEAFKAFPGMSEEFETALTDPQKQKIAIQAIQKFVENSNLWMRLKCLDIDVAASLDRKSLAILGPATDHSSSPLAVCKFFSNTLTSAEALQLNNEPEADDTGGALLDGATILLDKKRAVTNDITASRHHTLPSAAFFSVGSLAGNASILAAQFSVNMKTKDGRVFTGPGATLLIAGNYVIPQHSYKTSKVFAVPVMEFDPKTGDPVAFFDLGLLHLMNLPKQGNYLASVIGAGDVPNWKDFNLEKVGNFASKMPGKRGQYLSMKEVESFGFKPFWKTERLPVGAMHYVPNGRWHNMTKNTPFGVVHHSLTRDELLDLYKGDSGKLNLAVNSLDYVSTNDIKDFSFKLDSTTLPAEVCKAWNDHRLIGHPAGTFLETEFVLFPGGGDAIM